MIITPKLPTKVQYLLNFSFPLVNQLCQRTNVERFVGGRLGYDKQMLFTWLLVKKITNWDFRTIASMAGVSHPTLIRANNLFLKKGVYEGVLKNLVKTAYRERLIDGKYIAVDSSFVHTFSKSGELGSEGWNEFKQGFGFKLHLLLDTESRFPLAISVTNGLASDNTLAVPLLKRGYPWLRKTKYVLADKGYDDLNIINWVNKILQAKAGIPIKRHKRGKNYSWAGSFRNYQQKIKGRSLKRSIYNRRSAIEGVFSLLKRSYHLGKEQTRGIVNFSKNCYLALICYILKLFYVAKLT